ncbi:MAG: ABC transporter permease subunit [Deltaproteobacteria bacterium]|nr:ABC transporter permease subunit [Candidatus Anaeroferrophillacea bacterium]
MQQVLHILNKEWKDYFLSPIAYLVIAVFLLVTGWLFFSTFFIYNQADMRNFFGMLPITFAFVVPAITMKQFSEELNTGSYELLMTLPVSFRDVILGKFLACVLFIAVTLAPTLVYALCIALMGELDWGVVAGGYLGALLLGGAYAAVGLLASSLTRNQIIAYIVGIAVCFLLTIVDKMLFFFPRHLLGLVNHLAAEAHFRNIAKGIVDSRDLLYFFSIMFIGLYATHLTMRERM